MMRTAMCMASLALALAATAPALAAQKQNVTGGAASSGTVELKKPTKAPKGIVGSTTGTMALTASECTTLGGTVYDDNANLCGAAGGQYCGTTDKDGVRHRVCIEAAK